MPLHWATWGKVVLPAGISPATSAFEARCSIIALREQKVVRLVGINQLPRVYETHALSLSYRSIKWCAGAVSRRLPSLCQRDDLLLIYRHEWLPRTDSHSVVLIQSQAGYYYLTGQKMEPTAGIAPASSALQKRRDYLSIHVGEKVAEVGGHAPHSQKERSVFETVPMRLSGSTSMKKSGSPRCRPVLCELRARCITAMLVTRKAETSGHAPQSPNEIHPASNRWRLACPL